MFTGYRLPSQGKNLVHLIDRPDDPHCFRLHRDRVYYVSEANMRMSISIARPNLITVGTCLGKFSKSGVFKLHITALDILAQYAKYKVWENTKLGGSEKEGGGRGSFDDRSV